MVSSTNGSVPHWSGDGRKLFYISSTGDFLAVDIVPGATFQSLAPRRMFGSTSGFAYSLTPTADKFLFLGIPPDAGTVPPFTLVLNWTSRLRK
jgi:Tol biopolymer transport system component